MEEADISKKKLSVLQQTDEILMFYSQVQNNSSKTKSEVKELNTVI